jgi:hypothetical protein
MYQVIFLSDLASHALCLLCSVRALDLPCVLSRRPSLNMVAKRLIQLQLEGIKMELRSGIASIKSQTSFPLQAKRRTDGYIH